MIPYEEYIKSLPRKRIGSAAIFFNEQNQIFIVKPTYRDGWLVPGGAGDAFESPLHCCKREVREELGLVVEEFKLLGVNHTVLRMKNGDMDDGLHFIYYGGVLTPDQISKINLQKEELSEFEFVEVKEAYSLLSDRLSKRIEEGVNALNAGTVFYSEYGVE
jgi:8-oxo-dGTP pyrophosphatase MutT (NUDIX family)